MKVGPNLLAVFLALAAAGTEDWPQFRGPQARGWHTNTPAPVSWNVESGENVRWQTPVPGLSHAAPILWGDRVFVASATREGDADLKVGLYGDIASANDQLLHQWRLLALDRASGRVLWNKVGHEAVPRVKRHTKASHCNSTPATDGRRIVAIFGSEGLFCFDMEGAPLWKMDLGAMDSGYFQVPTAQWGFASSPVLHDGRVIVQCDVQTNSFVAAFDAADGRELWRTPRRDVPTWGTPTVAAAGVRTHVLVNGWHHIGAYDFADGREVWRLDGGGDIPVPTPVVAHGFYYQTSGHGRFRPMRAIRLDATGDITPPDVGGTNSAVAWAHPRQGTYMQTPIVLGNEVFGCLDNGVLTCFDAHSGKIHYSERLAGGEGFTASPVSDGRHLYFASEIGNVFTVPTGVNFSVAATNRLGETCMATPAIAGGTLYFRTRGKLVAVGR
ncbi:MAG: PQQ-binding-like beta-propeller repeat protein [Limisphaerales bacterium]